MEAPEFHTPATTDLRRVEYQTCSERARTPEILGVASSIRAGTNPRLPRFQRMKIREENCNMVLLAAVTVFSVIVGAGAGLLGADDQRDVQLAARAELAADKATIHYVNDQTAVRVVGAPFVPNTNPRER